MKNLFDTATASEIQSRLENLGPQSQRQWGKMTAPQMLAHCSIGLRWALGEEGPEKVPLPMRLIGRLVKPMVFRNDDPLRRNAPTAKSLIISGDRDLRQEQERLSALVNKFSTGGTAVCTKNPHSFFGKLTPDEWGILMYKHLDHHLRQFAV